MANAPDRIEFWKEFICTRCRFPAPKKLREQFANASFCDFCACGCNSFRVEIAVGSAVAPIAERGPRAMIFEADFHLAEQGKTLEILLFSGEEGNLSYVEIDCCGNSYPVPDIIDVKEPPFHVYESTKLIS